MWRDDLDTAFRHLDLYERFGCPGGHIQAAFRCVVRFGATIDPKVAETLNGRVHACWINPSAQPQAAAAPACLAAVFDLEVAARAAAVATLVGSIHADQAHNHVLFFDPAKERLEPLLWDANGFGIHAEPTLPVAAPRVSAAAADKLIVGVMGGCIFGLAVQWAFRLVAGANSWRARATEASPRCCAVCRNPASSRSECSTSTRPSPYHAPHAPRSPPDFAPAARNARP